MNDDALIARQSSSSVKLRIEGWKVDMSLWFAGVPLAVEPLQAELPARLTLESRLAIRPDP
jgi:hypothetical protein